jgi:hypothetical protein
VGVAECLSAGWTFESSPLAKFVSALCRTQVGIHHSQFTLKH